MWGVENETLRFSCVDVDGTQRQEERRGIATARRGVIFLYQEGEGRLGRAGVEDRPFYAWRA